MSSWWVDLRNTLETIVGDAAPIVLSAVGGPAGAAVGSMIADALGTTPANAAAVLATDPNALAKIKTLEIEKGLEIARLDASTRLAQIKSNEISIAKLGLFGAWEDAVGWVCAAIFAEAFLLLPTSQAIASWIGYTLHGWPVYHLSVILTVLGTLMGTNGLKQWRLHRS